jgi:hypothetical protein
MSRETGGPAFPQIEQLTQSAFGGQFAVEGSGGMTLRDYFAAKAMQALIASNDEGAGDRLTEIPEYAYGIADAMLAERSKP